MLFKKVAEILADIIEIDADDIEPETEFIKEYGMRAIDVAKLVINCEKKFKITIHDEDVHGFKRVNDIVDYIEEKLSENAALPSDKGRESWYYK
ncbi:MAG: Acyl carrier protein [Firmicutes bacterium ADurb.Bin300]|nr:MAG: Acyl carrier protein [Firmicutes bacterium ADurb.Bin300]